MPANLAGYAVTIVSATDVSVPAVLGGLHLSLNRKTAVVRARGNSAPVPLHCK